MSVASTPRVVIDLPLEEPTTTTTRTTVLPHTSWSTKQVNFAVSRDHPPAKRQRVSGEYRQRELAKACVQKLFLPHVARAIDRLSPVRFAVDRIAIDTVTRLLVSTKFFNKAKAADGVLTTREVLDLEAHVALLVQQLASLPEYQKREQNINTSVARTLPKQSTLSRARPQPSPKPVQLQPFTSSQSNTQTTQISKPTTLGRQLTNPSNNNTFPAVCSWLQLRRKPYLTAESRGGLAQGVKNLLLQKYMPLPGVCHADFATTEISEIILRLRSALRIPLPLPSSKTKDTLAQLLHKYDIAKIIGDSIAGRTAEDVQNLCVDIQNRRTNSNPCILSLTKVDFETRALNRRTNSVSSMLLAREIEGNTGFGRMRQYMNFQNRFRVYHEDGLSVIAEFTNCAGDITTMCWVPTGHIICGTTAHSDSHNQQYNKPGNLLLCSTAKGTLQAFADHRIPRPVVERGENSTDAMRQCQDPWLYSSVVSSDYDHVYGRAFTSSFDMTVKVWNISKTTHSMQAMATWHHQGNVNFVAAAKDGSGRVATAADVPAEAIRIYTVDPINEQKSKFYTVPCTRNVVEKSEKWAYFPATMQWGRSPSAQHLLAIGYSPRSLTCDDNDIPEDKLHSGEIVLWDAARRTQVPVLTATTANVFEIMWHPTIPRFIAATSRSGLVVEQGTRTNIHIFQLDRERVGGAYCEIQKLDCPASDINELAIMPNSLIHAFIAAGCTDGRVYVWDTAQGDRPIHVLKHNNPLDEFTFDREKEDTGIKFCAWGITADRLYTGSSDGVVKVWNIRRRRRPFVRNLIEAPGPISCGIFSPDRSKLVVGDATGRVFLLSIDKRDSIGTQSVTFPGLNHRVRRPKPFTPHPEPPPPSNTDRDAGLTLNTIELYSRETYLSPQKLILHKNPTIGAIQGPLYNDTQLYRVDAHVDFDPQNPLIPEFERNQRATRSASIGPRSRSIQRLKDPVLIAIPDEQHVTNLTQDLDVEILSDPFIDKLISKDIQLCLKGEEGWDFDYKEILF